MAIDGHAIGSCSEENNLGEAGYKFKHLKEDQVNLLMGYDIKTGLPLFSRMYRGTCNDKATTEELAELLELLEFSGILFVIDRRFYSKNNLKILFSNENTYIIPAPSNTDGLQNAMKDLKYTDSFYYRSGKSMPGSNTPPGKSVTQSVCMYSAISTKTKNAVLIISIAWNLEKTGYTQEKFEQNKEKFGVYVLQSNATKSADEIFADYKKR